MSFCVQYYVLSWAYETGKLFRFERKIFIKVHINFLEKYLFKIFNILSSLCFISMSLVVQSLSIFCSY